MAVYLTGDIHGELDIRKLSSHAWPKGNELTKDDYLVILGDFGLVWGGSPLDEWWLDWLQKKPWTTLFIDGNHENHVALANDFEEVELLGGHAHRVRDDVYHLMRGYVFDIDCGGRTKSFAVMGGAESIDRAYRVEGRSWWPQEIPDETERERLTQNLEKRDWKVDYVLTHDAPAILIPKLAMLARLGDTCHANEFESWLGGIEYKLDYEHWWFGHWHLDANVSPLHTVLYYNIEKLEFGEKDA